MTTQEALYLLKACLNLEQREDHLSYLIASNGFERIRKWLKEIPSDQINLEHQKIHCGLPWGYMQTHITLPIGPHVPG